ncbi:MAG: class I SAM-dependent methyltransferase [Edaphobacter sp.]
MDQRSHWENIYRSKNATSVSWYRPHLELSFELIRRAAQSKKSSILDIGGGVATLVDDLVRDGFEDVSVLDIAAAALEVSQQRLGEAAKQVTWIAADFLNAELEPRRYDICHDRAVFHFLNLPEERAKYVRQAARILRPGGVIILATFALDGPERCSGLPVSRYDETSLLKELGGCFELVESHGETHHTPSGQGQQLLYCVLRLIGI